LKPSIPAILTRSLKTESPPDSKGAVGEVLSKALGGEGLSVEDGCVLLEAEPHELPAVFGAAWKVRRKAKGRKMTYSRKVFIPLTRLCRNACAYCGFRRPPSPRSRLFLKPEEVLKIAAAGRNAGCTEALFTLGEKPEEKYPEAEKALSRMGYSSTLDYLADLCQAVHEKTGLLPHSNPGVLSLKEMAALREVNVSMGLMLENISPRLCQPGGPHEFSPGKHPHLRLATLEHAGKLRVAFTTGLLFGIGEKPRELVESLSVISKLNREYGHVQEVILQPFAAKPRTPMGDHPEPEGLETLRVLAVSRLVLGGEMNLQVPPNLAASVASALPLAGANDWGGVSPVTLDHVNPEKAWPSIPKLRRITEGCGLELRQRLPVYPEYVVDKPEFIPEALKPTVLGLVDGEGYVRREKEAG